MLKNSKLLKFIPLVLLSLASCNGNNPGKHNPPVDPEEEEVDLCAGDPLYSGETVEVSKITNHDGKYNISVENKDFLFLGTQIRVDAFMNCDKYNYADIKNLFREAANLGVTCVQIPVEWSKIEKKQDEYNFKYVHEMLSYANEYDLKVELLWFGSNMCGDSHSNSVPNYILADGRTYPKFDALRTGEYWNYYGIMWFLDFDNQNLIARESKVLEKLMEYIYWFDSTHSAKKPVIGIQIENEADIFPRWRIDQQSVLDPSTHEKMEKDVGFTKICNSLNALGNTVKAAKYKVYTRANLASSTSETGIYSGSTVKDAPAFAKQILALPGIDIVGDDSYTSNVKNIKGISYMFRENIGDNNFSHIAENAGNYENTSSLILAALSQHGGYSIYDLVTSPFFIANGSASTNQGIVDADANKNLTHKRHFDSTKTFIDDLKKVEDEIYKLSSDDFIALNIKNDYPQSTITQNISSTNISVKFETSTQAIGYALDFGNYVDVLVTGNSKITLSNCTVSKITEGNIIEDGFVGNNVTASQEVQLQANKLYRIEYTSSGKITSTTWENIGA